uniref:Uncharacterized protein n=1 Tax=Opuntia streptacantha TaxID=393608 RepID=A0A7C9CGG2_OPUST
MLRNLPCEKHNVECQERFTSMLLGEQLSEVGVDIYRTLCRLFKSKEELDEPAKRAEFEILGRKVFGATVRCSASLVFAAIGAGIGATLLRPSLGQWVGCALGDLAGPVIVSVCFDKFLRSEP